MMPSASRTAAVRMSASESESGISARTVRDQSCDRVHFDPAPGENAREQLGHVVVALRDRERAGPRPRSSSRSRHAPPRADRSTPRKARRVRAYRCCEGDRHLVRAESLSKKLTILDEAGTLRQPVIEHAGVRIGFMGEPVDAARARSPCSVPRPPDQGASDPKIARAFGDEQVLEIAVVADRPARTVEKGQVVHDAAQAPIPYRHRTRPSPPSGRAGAPRSPPWLWSGITTL